MRTPHLAASILVGLFAITADAAPVRVQATPVLLNVEDPAQRTFGGLTYKGGLVLRSSEQKFGGFSALGVSANGGRMVALSDRGHRFAARLVYDESGAVAGLRETHLDTMAGPDGFALSEPEHNDAEAMSPGVEGEIIVAFEGLHRLWRYLPDQTLPQPLAVPDELTAMPGGGGIRGLALLRDGRLLALSRGLRAGGNAIGWVSDAQGWSVLTYSLVDGYQTAGAASLPGGDVLVLESYLSAREANHVRIRRVAENTIKAGARLEGELLAEMRPPLTTDNFEGIAVRQDADGKVFVYLLSDNNFNDGQRTILMMFEMTI